MEFDFASSALALLDTPTSDLGDHVADQASQTARLLQDLVRCSAFSLTAWSPTSQTHSHQTLASDGYSEDTISYINDGYISRCPAFAIAHRHDRRSLRWRDYKRDWNLTLPDTLTAQEFLIPSGFKEGSTMCLRLPDGRYVGAFHMSWTSPVAATDDRRELTERFRPIMVNICDQLRAPQFLADELAPNAFAVLLSPDGLAFQLPNRAPGPHLGAGGKLRHLLLERLRPLIHRRFIWQDDAGCCHRVAIMPCRGNVVLVTEEASAWPHDLSLRELQVLHLVAAGASNPEIAERLFVSPRTVSTHVEHILAKMNCNSRTRLATMAVSEGLLLAETPARRAAGRKAGIG